jgi:c-di-GMP-binding flagellar brake protein YcgR
MRLSLKPEDIKYIKILYNDGTETPKSVKAIVKRMNDFEIFACAKIEEGLYIKTPQEITLGIICNDGLYHTKTKLKYVDNDEPLVYFAIERPDDLEYQQNREYFRIAAEYNCIYRVTFNQSSREIKAKTSDISANGVSIIYPERLVVDDDAEIVIDVEGRKISTKIRYIRSEKCDVNYKLSFKFVDMSESDSDYISKICIQKQLKERGKGL